MFTLLPVGTVFSFNRSRFWTYCTVHLQRKQSSSSAMRFHCQILVKFLMFSFNIHQSLSARALLSNRVKLEVYHEYFPSKRIFIFASSSFIRITGAAKQNSTRPLVSTLWLISKINSPSLDKILEFSCIIKASDRERPFSLLSLM